jgi:hypothetical protein
VQETFGEPGALLLSVCPSLLEVGLQDCPGLEQITGLGDSLTRLLVGPVKALPDLSPCTNLQRCTLHGQQQTLQPPGATGNSPIDYSDICVPTADILKLPDLSRFRSLQELEVTGSWADTSRLAMPPTSLTRLAIHGLDTLQQLQLHTSLRELRVESCTALSLIHGLTPSSDHGALSLSAVKIAGCSSLPPLPCLCKLPNFGLCMYEFCSVPISWCAEGCCPQSKGLLVGEPIAVGDGRLTCKLGRQGGVRRSMPSGAVVAVVCVTILFVIAWMKALLCM